MQSVWFELDDKKIREKQEAKMRHKPNNKQAQAIQLTSMRRGAYLPL